MKGSEVPMRIRTGEGGAEEIQVPDGEGNEGFDADSQSSGLSGCKQRF